MATYEIETESGARYQIETESPKVKGVFGDIPSEDYKTGTRNIMGNIAERPFKATTGASQGLIGGTIGNLVSQLKQGKFSPMKAGLEGLKQAKENYIKGSINPPEVSSYKEKIPEFMNNIPILKDVPGKEYLKYVPFPAGNNPLLWAENAAEIADFGNDPLQVGLATIAPKLGKTKVGKYIGEKTGNIINKTAEKLTPGGKPKSVKFAENVRNSLFEEKRKIGRNFGKAIDDLAAKNPNKAVDLSDSARILKSTLEDIDSPQGLKIEVKSIIKKINNPETSKLLLDIIENPEKASNLTLRQAQDIKIAIQNAPSIKNKFKKGKFADWSYADTELLDLIDRIRLSESEMFPEIKDIRKPFSEYMSYFDKVKNKIKSDTLLNRIRKGFGTEEAEYAAKKALPKESYKKIKSARRNYNIKEKTKAATGTALKYGVGFELLRRLLKSIPGNSGNDYGYNT